MYHIFFSVKLFPKCHLSPIIRSPRNTPQYFFWKCVYFYTLFKLYTPLRTHLPHKEQYSFTQYPHKGANVNTTHRVYKTLTENTTQGSTLQDSVCQHVCVCVCVLQILVHSMWVLIHTSHLGTVKQFYKRLRLLCMLRCAFLFIVRVSNWINVL